MILKRLDSGYRLKWHLILVLCASSLASANGLMAALVWEPLSNCEKADLASNDTRSRTFEFRFGFGRKIKLGSWTPVFVTVPQGVTPATIEISAPDGNGIPVEFSGPCLHDSDRYYQGWFKLGRRVGSLQVRLFDDTGALLAARSFELADSSGFSVLDATVPMVLTFEPASVIAEKVKLIDQQMFGQPSEVVAINDPRHLVLNELPYQGVQLIYLSTSDLEFVRSISEKQLSALRDWVAGGGKLVWFAGKNGPVLFSDLEVWTRLLPATYDGPAQIDDGAPLEGFARSKQQLIARGSQPIPSTKITPGVGIVDLRIAGHPVVVRSPHQFGQIVFVAFDLDVEPLASWAGLKNLLSRATTANRDLNRIGDERTSHELAQIGYSDLAGQLYLPLEKFARAPVISFTLIAVLIGLFLLCIGPGDFYLLHKVLGKMEWTWLTFSLLAASFCGLAFYIAKSARPSQMQVNQLEIIDFDQQSKRIRGNVWTNIYSPNNLRLTISGDHPKSTGLKPTDMDVCWMGVPGNRLGSMGNTTSTSLRLDSYRCEFDSKSLASKLRLMPIRVSSTKAVHSSYRGESPVVLRSKLFIRKQTNRLQGTINNPFDFELRDCRVVYDDSVYVFQRPFAPGETINVYDDDEVKERTARSYFERRAETDSDQGGDTPWDPEEDDLSRLAELMMFFQTANGSNFTGLTHAYQPHVDLSELLGPNRAILFGKTDSFGSLLNFSVDSPLTSANSDSGLSSQSHAQSVTTEIHYDQRLTWVRMVMPVDRE